MTYTSVDHVDGDPTNNDPSNIRIVDIRENLNPKLWRGSPGPMPYTVLRSRFYRERIGVDVFETEKEAIDLCRRLRIEAIDSLQREVNALDLRYDAIEDQEMARPLTQ